MAFDGITVAAVTAQLNDLALGGKISKIAQPEADEIDLTIKNQGRTLKLLLSASAGLPLVYFTETTKPAPMQAPNFCMVLRKHIANGKIVSISQPGLERIITITVEHLDEMGDMSKKKLIIELMGKHSNIIFCREDDTIIDSIRHVSATMSSLREVFPGKTWFLPESLRKADPFTAEPTVLAEALSSPLTVTKYLNKTYSGISFAFAENLALLADCDTSVPGSEVPYEKRLAVAEHFARVMREIEEGRFSPEIMLKNGETTEFSALNLFHRSDCTYEAFPDISSLLEAFYARKNTESRMKQRSADLRKLVGLHLERAVKKLDLQEKQLKDTEKREQYRLYGELLTAYAYSAVPGAKEMTVTNYYDNSELTIPLDPTKTAMENAQKYYDRYNKLKRTFEAVTVQIAETREDIEHLDSVKTSIEMSMDPEDLTQIRRELEESGYLKVTYTGKKGKKEKILSHPHHYRSSDGYDIYVGKNNFQNEELTFRFAENGDLWFHAKGVPGSHVIVRCSGREVPDRTYEEAGALAAYYSKSRDNDKVEIDYIEKKQVKKPAGGKPGFVIYHTNYSLMATPDISGIEEI